MITQCSTEPEVTVLLVCVTLPVTSASMYEGTVRGGRLDDPVTVVQVAPAARNPGGVGRPADG
jgi:hypothetical protein